MFGFEIDFYSEMMEYVSDYRDVEAQILGMMIDDFASNEDNELMMNDDLKRKP